MVFDNMPQDKRQHLKKATLLNSFIEKTTKKDCSQLGNFSTLGKGLLGNAWLGNCLQGN